MIDIPGDPVWDLPCVQQASYLEVGPLVWMLPLYLQLIKNLFMMIYDIDWSRSDTAASDIKGQLFLARLYEVQGELL